MTSINIAQMSGNTARRDAIHYASLMMARHLRCEHGWGIRRIGRELGMTDRQVKNLLPTEGDRT